jgi:hypothetical protein
MLLVTQPDVPAPRRRCYGLRPGAPCPAHDDGTWPEGCDCQMDLRHYDGSLTKAGVALGLVVFALLFLAVWAVMEVAFGADVDCMSKEQARAKYPKQVIYWHTSKRCWNNTPLRAVHARAMPPPPADASGNATTGRAQRTPSVFYPTLMGGGGTSNDMLYPDTMQYWPLVSNFDEEPVPFIPWRRVSALFQ